MASIDSVQDFFPFSKAVVAGGITAVDPIAKTVVTNGAATLVSDVMDLRHMSNFSFNIQQTGTTGTSAGTWKIEGCNDYDSTRQVQSPGNWLDVTSDINAGAKPFSRIPAAVAGANKADAFACWCFPFAYARFTYTSTVSTTTTAAQFYAKGV